MRHVLAGTLGLGGLIFAAAACSSSSDTLFGEVGSAGSGGSTAGQAGSAPSSGGTQSGGASSTGGSGTGGSAGSSAGGSGGGKGGTGGTSGGDGGTGGTSGGTAGGSGSAGSGATGGSSAGDGGAGSSAGTGGSAGGGMVCTAENPFPEFDRTCGTADDCVLVAHTTTCCGHELVMAIAASEGESFTALEAQCDATYPLCDCIAQWVDVEDGTQVGFEWRSEVEARCDQGACGAHYRGETFECGTKQCVLTQYCRTTIGGPAGSEPSYTCYTTDCTDCDCLDTAGCTCSADNGHLTVTCYAP